MQARMFADRRSCWVVKGSDAEVPDAREVAPELAAGRGRQRGRARSSRRAGVAAGIHRFCFFDSKVREGNGVFGSGLSRRSRTPARPPRAAAGLELLGLLTAGGWPAARADPGAPACFLVRHVSTADTTSKVQNAFLIGEQCKCILSRTYVFPCFSQKMPEDSYLGD